MERRSVCYTLHGDPIPLARARHGNRRTWDSQKELKLINGIFLKNQHQGEFLTGPLKLDITFFFAIPKSRKKHNLNGKHYLNVPDLSNLIKFIEDVGSGIIYPDDRTIVEIISRKLYDTIPRTEIKITEL